MVLLSVTSAPEATLLIGLLFHNSASGTACMHVQHLRTRFSVDSSSFFAYLLAVWVPPLCWCSAPVLHPPPQHLGVGSTGHIAHRAIEIITIGVPSHLDLRPHLPRHSFSRVCVSSRVPSGASHFENFRSKAAFLGSCIPLQVCLRPLILDRNATATSQAILWVF